MIFPNLNRQCLFRRQHVGKPKATQAAASIREMISDTPIKGVLGNIKQVEFNIGLFLKFTLVCNALDNLEARRHVNRMCLAAKIPLIDSGSTGYVGQCDVIGPGFECYDCIDHPAPKSYAVCTIRSTPEKPVHCVVWAKFLFDLTFGPPDADNVLSDLDGNVVSHEQNAHGKDEDEAGSKVPMGEPNGPHQLDDSIISSIGAISTEDTNGSVRAADHVQSHIDGVANIPEANGSIVNGKGETGVGKDRATARGGTAKRVRFQEADTAESFSKRVCERVFIDDIEEQRRMESLWENRPAPLTMNVVALAKAYPLEDVHNVNALGQEAWSAETSAAVLMGVLKRMATERCHDIGSTSFDKDDRDALLLVTAASNLRSAAYGVELQSPFAVKGIAGNIVHAIATTNAIVGGLIALEALRLATNGCNVGECKRTFITKHVAGSRVCTLLQTDGMRKPNPKCFVCSKGQLVLCVDVDEMTLGMVLSGVLKRRMSMAQPIVYVSTGEEFNTLYECGEGLEDYEIEEYEQMASKSLRELKVCTGSQLMVEDLAQSIKCTLHVRHTPQLMSDLPADQRFTLEGDVPGTEPTGPANGKGAGNCKMEEVDDVEEVTEVDVDKSRPDWGLLEAEQNADVVATGTKRSLEMACGPSSSCVSVEQQRDSKKSRI